MYIIGMTEDDGVSHLEKKKRKKKKDVDFDNLIKTLS